MWTFLAIFPLLLNTAELLLWGAEILGVSQGRRKGGEGRKGEKLLGGWGKNCDNRLKGKEEEERR